jgi:hypothetical protein
MSEKSEAAAAAKAERAEAKAAAKATAVSAIDTHDRDPVLAIYAVHAPECVQVGTGWDCFVGDGRLNNQPVDVIVAGYEKQGYVAVKDKSGKQVLHNGDPLFKKKVAE